MMNAKQQRTFDKVAEIATLHGHYEVKNLKVEGNEYNADVYIQLEVGRPNDEGTLAECFCRDCFCFNIGPRGGIFFYNSNRDYAREYIRYYEIHKAEIWH